MLYMVIINNHDHECLNNCLVGADGRGRIFSMSKLVISLICLSQIVGSTGSLLRAETAEFADRTGLESVWKRSGRTTGVIDYPYSPQPGIYGGKDTRKWENRGYIFINPKTEEFARRRAGRTVAREAALVGEEDCAEVRKELAEEIVRNTRILEEKKELAEEIRELSQKADDRSIKIEALEFEIEELEKTTGAGELDITDREGGGIGEGGLEIEQTGTHMVREGENLWEIAGKPEVYNDPYRWLLLYHANRDQIFEPDLIYPGMVLLIPRYRGMERAPTIPVGEAEPAEPPVEDKELESEKEE